MDPRNTALAEQLIDYSVDLQKGEKIYLEVKGHDALELGRELVRTATLILLLTTLAVGAMLFLFAQPAPCAWCLDSFCAFSAECPTNCVCAIPWGEVTGSCTMSRGTSLTPTFRALTGIGILPSPEWTQVTPLSWTKGAR